MAKLVKFPLALEDRTKAQERQCRAVGMPAPLLPVAQRSHAHAEHEREGFLRLARPFADCLDIHRLNMEHAGWRHFITADFACLPDAFQQFVERFFFHSPYYTPLAQCVNGKIGFIENKEDAGIKNAPRQ